MADFVSKAVSCPILMQQSGWAMGHRFAPPKESEHFKILIELYKLSINETD